MESYVDKWGGGQTVDVERATTKPSSRIAKFAKFIHGKFENINRICKKIKLKLV